MMQDLLSALQESERTAHSASKRLSASHYHPHGRGQVTKAVAIQPTRQRRRVLAITNASQALTEAVTCRARQMEVCHPFVKPHAETLALRYLLRHSPPPSLESPDCVRKRRHHDLRPAAPLRDLPPRAHTHVAQMGVSRAEMSETRIFSAGWSSTPPLPFQAAWAPTRSLRSHSPPPRDMWSHSDVSSSTATQGATSVRRPSTKVSSRGAAPQFFSLEV
jgi:hypothetical protein